MKNQLIAFSEKDIGGRDEQQDKVVHLVSTDESRALLVLADGMGGHSGGKMASSCVYTTAKVEWQASEEALSFEPNIILSNIFKLSYNCMKLMEKKKNISPRSTCVALLLKEDIAYFAHVGDSRLFHFRNGRLFNKTKDHSVVQMLADMEQITEEEMGAHEDQGRLLKWIGGEKEPDPTFSTVEVLRGDQFMLCSDGLWEYVKVEQMEHILSTVDDLRNATESLIKIAREVGGEKGDNISVALLNITKDTKDTKDTKVLLFIVAVLLFLLSFLLGYGFFTSENKEKGVTRFSYEQSTKIIASSELQLRNSTKRNTTYV